MRPYVSVRPRLLFAQTKMVFSVKEGAAYLGVSPRALRRMIAQGALRAGRWGTGHLLLRDDLDQMLQGPSVERSARSAG